MKEVDELKIAQVRKAFTLNIIQANIIIDNVIFIEDEPVVDSVRHRHKQPQCNAVKTAQDKMNKQRKRKSFIKVSCENSAFG